MGDADNASLIAAVLNGAFETPLWSEFLNKLRKSTGATFATLTFRPREAPSDEAVHLFSGDIPSEEISRLNRKEFDPFDLLSDLNMIEGRGYDIGELYPPRIERHLGIYHSIILASGVQYGRMIRVMEPTGVSAWLSISSLDRDLSAEATGSLETIAPVLRGALRFHVALERERFTASVTGDAMRRLHFGWITLNSRGQVLDYDEEAGRVLAISTVLRKGPNDRLIAWPPDLDREVSSAINAVLANPLERPRAITLSRDPWLDMLMVSVTQKRLSANPRAAVVLYVHGDSWLSSDRCDQLGQLFDLSPGEARLALALSRGMTITEAAGKFGLQVDTVRKYSKAIYAKTGARGLPDLVRLVMRSVLALAPER